MKLRRWCRGAVLLSVSLLALPAAAADDLGTVMGWVQDTHGAPLPGAVVSVFGRGLSRSGLVTLSDSAGRFLVRALPPGSYTVRALRDGHEPAQARKVTVLANQRAIFTLSLTPREAAPAVAESVRELQWLVRHKPRSVLEQRTAAAGASGGAAPYDQLSLASLDALSGTVELVTNPAAVGVSTQPFDGDRLPTSLSVLRLSGRAGAAQWSLGGLVAENSGLTWRMAAEFAVQPGGGHEISAGAGYGTRLLRPLVADGRSIDNRSEGTLFVQDRWRISETVATTLGGRFSHVGFLRDSNHLDPTLSIDLTPEPTTRLRGTLSRRTLTPGGDLLALSSLASPVLAYAVLGSELRPERSIRCEVALDQRLGASTTVRALTFFEGVEDQLANVFALDAGRSLRIVNAGGTAARGVGLSVARRFGGGFNGSVTYMLGHSRRRGGDRLGTVPVLSYEEGEFQDLVARLEAFIDGSDTRVVAFYRVNTLTPEVVNSSGAPVTSTRFDVQLSQGLPFLGQLTSADWDFLLAVRNVFYEPDEGATLDELAVVNPPTRVVGGISVRF